MCSELRHYFYCEKPRMAYVTAATSLRAPTSAYVSGPRGRDLSSRLSAVFSFKRKRLQISVLVNINVKAQILGVRWAWCVLQLLYIFNSYSCFIIFIFDQLVLFLWWFPGYWNGLCCLNGLPKWCYKDVLKQNKWHYLQPASCCRGLMSPSSSHFGSKVFGAFSEGEYCKWDRHICLWKLS